MLTPQALPDLSLLSPKYKRVVGASIYPVRATRASDVVGIGFGIWVFKTRI